MAQHPRTIIDLVNQCPPFLVVGLARRRTAPRKGMSTADISRETGIAQRTLTRILAKDDWSGVKLGHLTRIFTACSIDVFQMSRIKEYVKETNFANCPFRHLSAQQRLTLYRRMASWSEKKA